MEAAGAAGMCKAEVDRRLLQLGPGAAPTSVWALAARPLGWCPGAVEEGHSGPSIPQRS
jgi:hypothetical protein